jgi:hypothetical protein
VNDIGALGQPSAMAWFRSPDGLLPLSLANIYEVYAIVLHDDGLMYYVFDEDGLEYPLPYPAVLFKVVDGRVDGFILGDSDATRLQGRFDVRLSFAEWARDANYYERLVEGEPAARRSLSSYRASLR